MITCKNCSREFDGKYCPDCGQNSKIEKITFKDIFSSVSNEIFNFDSKIYLTFKSLFLQSGNTSLDYVSGKRKRYINPITYYFITISILIVVMKFFPYDYEKISAKILKGTQSEVSNLEMKLQSEKDSLFLKYKINYDEIEDLKSFSLGKDSTVVRELLGIKQLESVILIQTEMPELIVENYKFFNFLIFLPFPLFLRIFFSKKKYPFTMAELFTFTAFTAAQINLISAPFHIINNVFSTGIYMFLFLIIPIIYVVVSAKTFFKTSKLFSYIKFFMAYIFTYLLFMILVAAGTMIYISMMKL